MGLLTVRGQLLGGLATCIIRPHNLQLMTEKAWQAAGRGVQGTPEHPASLCVFNHIGRVAGGPAGTVAGANKEVRKGCKLILSVLQT